MKPLKSLLSVAAICLALPAFAQDMVVSDAYVLPLAGVDNAAALYLVAMNGATVMDTLLGATCDQAGTVALWQTRMNNKYALENFPQPEGVNVAPAAGLVLVPGSYHVALLELKAPLKAGDTVNVMLNFAVAGQVPVAAVVR